MNNNKYSSRRVKVTKTSRHRSNTLLIGVGIITVLGLSIILGGQLSSNSKKETQKDNQIPECNKKECLFTSNKILYGFATLEGYYRQYEGTGWGNQRVKCDSLVVTGGSKKLIGEFREFVRSGNTINTIINNDLLVNIYFSELNPDEKKLLKQSSPAKPIKVSVVKRFEEGSEAPNCFSFIDIISVDRLDE